MRIPYGRQKRKKWKNEQEKIRKLHIYTNTQAIDTHSRKGEQRLQRGEKQRHD